MKTNTIEEYIKAVKAKYEEAKTGEYSSFLMNPSPAELKILCLLLFDNGISKQDQEIVDVFFIDKDGVRRGAWSENIAYAAAIVRKKTRTKLPSTSSTVKGTKVDVKRSVDLKTIDPSSALLGVTATSGAASY